MNVVKADIFLRGFKQWFLAMSAGILVMTLIHSSITAFSYFTNPFPLKTLNEFINEYVDGVKTYLIFGSLTGGPALGLCQLMIKSNWLWKPIQATVTGLLVSMLLSVMLALMIMILCGFNISNFSLDDLYEIRYLILMVCVFASPWGATSFYVMSRLKRKNREADIAAANALKSQPSTLPS